VTASEKNAERPWRLISIALAAIGLALSAYTIVASERRDRATELKLAEVRGQTNAAELKGLLAAARDILSGNEGSTEIVVTTSRRVPRAAQEKAKRKIELALAIDPQNGEAHRLLGLCYRLSGDHQGARSEFSRSLQLNPMDFSALLDLAAERRDASDLSGAEMAYRAIIRDGSRHERFLAQIAMAKLLWNAERISEAMVYAVASCAAEPEHYLGHYYVGLLAASLDDDAKAAASCKLAGELQPDHAGVYLCAARAYHRMAQTMPVRVRRDYLLHAEHALRAGIRRATPVSGALYEELGAVLEALARVSDAIDAYRTALDFPDEVDPQFALHRIALLEDKMHQRKLVH
jgi:tetratricopeptide (TPR) repeat protein